VPPRSPFDAFNTFYADGNASEIGFGISPAYRTVSHGRWIRTGRRSFANNLALAIFDANGLYAGYQLIDRMIELSADGQTLTSRARFNRYGPSDELIFSGCANETGARLAEPTPF